MQYTIRRTSKVPLFRDEDFAGAEVAEIKNWVETPKAAADHRPEVKLQVLHDDTNIYGLYTVKDRYVRAVAKEYQDQVCLDSCVEFFFKPSDDTGYFNLEMSAGSQFLLYYITDNTPDGENYRKMEKVAPEYGRLITVKTTMPHYIEPEITEPTIWQVMFTIPLEAIEPYCGKIGCLNGLNWKGNFYKCADKTSHPHWITWAPITKLNYHLPECFQTVILE